MVRKQESSSSIMSFFHCTFLILSVLVLCPLSPITIVTSSRVFELTDRFIETYQTLTPSSNGWLVKFYAPWCHYCRKLEPIYMQLAQRLDELNLPVHVGRADCTKFDTMTTMFNIRGFPTIKYISVDKVIEFTGDRSIEELTDFAKRMTGSKIRPINNCDQMVQLLDSIPNFMVYFGPKMSESFLSASEHFHSNLWFFHCINICPTFTEGFYSVKGSPEHVHSIKFEEESIPDANSVSQSEASKLTAQEKEEEPSKAILEFVSKYRFPQFVKMTASNTNTLLHSNNVLIIALVDEYEPNRKLYTKLDEQFKQTLNSVALEYFDSDIIFGWSSNWDMINSLTLFNIQSLPVIVVVNSTTTQYYIHGTSTNDRESEATIEEEASDEELTKEEVLNLIQRIKNGILPFTGGNDWWTRIKRRSFDGINNLVSMYKGNPVLTLLIFGLPLTFLSFIIYSTCFTDILDGTDGDNDDELDADDLHEKTE